jgi:hypothetical protein
VLVALLGARWLDSLHREPRSIGSVFREDGTVMGKFRKKPVVIEAWRFDGSFECFESIAAATMHHFLWNPNNSTLIVPTLEGDHIANRGDWIIRGIKGEVYPCKPDIFEATYEPE